jgi:hypothetical protein
MTTDERQTLADRLAEIRERLDAISEGAEIEVGSGNKHLYAEMVSLERRLFATQKVG